MKGSITIMVNDEPLNVIVEYTVTVGTPGFVSGKPEDCIEPVPDVYEIEDLWVDDGKEVYYLTCLIEILEYEIVKQLRKLK